ncbi:5-carboxymethyl-2-hydroxymuconate Delta-isomerase [Lentzea sp. NPDC059081]|uniref:5-carboxymethyl-2-hydroxymuconate Delta-isomerase n=1 Tax=Lentzea sp. NPDC059081 TaxID=3346719 RepID=UPI0036C8E62D
MPQITVEYSAELAEGFDRRGFALAVHHALAPLVSSEVGDFKTRFRTIEESVIGDGAPAAMVHVRVGLLTGRPVELKQEVGRVTIGLVREHLKPVEGLPTKLTLEVYDLDRAPYQKLAI